VSSSAIFGALCLGPRVDRCESVHRPGIPRSYRAVRITARGYGLVKCAEQRWWVLGQSMRICLLPSSQRSILIHTTGLRGGSALRHVLAESSFEALAPPVIPLSATPMAATLNRLVVALTAHVRIRSPVPARRQPIRLAWPRPSVPVRLRPSGYRVDRALLQPSFSARGSSDAD
jgi:hypothetical protein